MTVFTKFLYKNLKSIFINKTANKAREHIFKIGGIILLTYFNVVGGIKNLKFLTNFLYVRLINSILIKPKIIKRRAESLKNEKNKSICFPYLYSVIRTIAITFYKYKVIAMLVILMPISVQASLCKGKFVNPITDICWSCIYPMTIGGMKVAGRNMEDTPNPSGFICFCPKGKLKIPTPGVPISFWEPARLVDVTRTPYCLVNMGGIQMAGGGRMQGRGTVADKSHSGGLKRSFYQVHWYIYPVIYWLELLTDFLCLEKASFDVAYITELDPFWNDDETNFILNPEAVLFANPIAQAACAADCALASSGFPNDLMFWCGGCQGSIYPFTGSTPAHVGGVQASLLVLQRMMAKLHREGLLWGYMGKAGWCGRYPMPIIRKSQYKIQMTYPIPSTQKGCHPLGWSETLWASGKEFPYQGEDFGYLVWRKRSCCLL